MKTLNLKFTIYMFFLLNLDLLTLELYSGVYQIYQNCNGNILLKEFNKSQDSYQKYAAKFVQYKSSWVIDKDAS